MRNRYARWVAAGVLVAAMAVQTPCADAARVVRSVAFPGMGQLGDNQTARGLLYMAGEIALLSMTVDQIVRKAAYDRATEYDSVRVSMATTYEEKDYYTKDWQDMYDKSGRAATLTYVFGGAAAVWWVWNIVDAIVFAPKHADGEQGALDRIRDNTTVCISRDKAQVSYRFAF